MKELPLVALGCMLHDIGKVIQRATGDDPPHKSHSRYGTEFVAELVSTNEHWRWVLECIQYHHWKDIKDGSALLPLSWFAFEADNLASAHDRKQAPFLFDSEGNRVSETDLSDGEKWDKYRRLDSIFVNFNCRAGAAKQASKLPLWFRRASGRAYSRDPYPYPEIADRQNNALENYQTLVQQVLTPLIEFLKASDPFAVATANTVLHYLEENLSMVPPDTFREHTNDVSLYDHLKLTAAIGTCMYSYVSDRHPEWLDADGSKCPWSRDFRKEPAYLLVKADVSGIQEFIYNISSKAALKGLRGRSFYLELLQTQLSDQLLEHLRLTRANLLYQGGGGFVLLAPNTGEARSAIGLFRDQFNAWLFNQHRGRLFLGLEFATVTGEELKGGNSTGGAGLRSAWSEVSSKLAAAKSEKFKGLLERVFKSSEFVAECKICHRDDRPLHKLPLSSDETLEVCEVCSQIIDLGMRLPDAAYKEGTGKSAKLNLSAAANGAVPYWNEATGTFDNCTAAIGPADKKRDGASFILHNYDPFEQPKLFWSLHEYKNNEFKELSKAATGVERLAVLRADVDNLGKVFSGQDPTIGLPHHLRSISRDAAVSRALARFFAHYLDDLLSGGGESRHRDWAITTVYSGGDDIFLVGAWDQIIDFALLFQEKFASYTLDRLTISAGISIHKPGYPLYRMARDAQDAEHVAKLSGKDRLCISFDHRIAEPGSASHCFVWRDWQTVVKPLVATLESLSIDTGISGGFWGYLLEYSRSSERSFYKLLYNIARMEERHSKLAIDSRWLSFKREWLLPLGSRRDSGAERILETALNWFILLGRETDIPKGRYRARKVAPVSV